jgi:hypothetical protein
MRHEELFMLKAIIAKAKEEIYGNHRDPDRDPRPVDPDNQSLKGRTDL